MAGLASTLLAGSPQCDLRLATKDHVNVFLYEAALEEMLRQIVANNRAGGWRKLKRERGLD